MQNDHSGARSTSIAGYSLKINVKSTVAVTDPLGQNSHKCLPELQSAIYVASGSIHGFRAYHLATQASVYVASFPSKNFTWKIS